MLGSAYVSYSVSCVCVFLCFPVIIKKNFRRNEVYLYIISIVYFYFKCVIWCMHFSSNIYHFTFSKTVCAILKVFFKGVTKCIII